MNNDTFDLVIARIVAAATDTADEYDTEMFIAYAYADDEQFIDCETDLVDIFS